MPFRSRRLACRSLFILAMFSTSCLADPTIDDQTAVQICRAFTRTAIADMPAVVTPQAAQELISAYPDLPNTLEGCLSATESGRDSRTVRFLIQHTRYMSEWQFLLSDTAIDHIRIERYRAVTLADDQPWRVAVSRIPEPAANVDRRPASASEPPAGSREHAHHSRKASKRVGTSAASRPTVDSAEVAPAPAPDPNVVEFYYATNRKRSDAAASWAVANPSGADSNSSATGWNDVADYTGERNSALAYGAIRVRVPEDHQIGKLELAQDLKIFKLTIWHVTPDQTKYFIIRSIKETDEQNWVTAIASGNRTKSPADKKALIFVHGFNTKFQDAAFRTAQIVGDLQFRGTPVLFSWPSRGEIADYLYDKDSALGSRDALLQVVRNLNQAGIDDISIIAHSMGNLVAVDALANSSSTQSPAAIAQLVMAAPDVDRDMFIEEIPKLAKVAKGLTLYASSNDKALQLSMRVAGNIPRAGDVPQGGPVVLSPLVTIDVSALGDELFGLNHNTFATARNVLDDLKLLLSTGAPAPRLTEIHAYPDPPQPVAYFRYMP
jgi:esterase/lipase superfamily enzyme